MQSHCCSCDSSFEIIEKINPDGVFLSNGPGDPAATSIFAKKCIQKILDKKIPIFGICLGHQCYFAKVY